MYLLIVLLPLIGSLIAGFGGRFIGVTGATLITPLCVFSSFGFSLIAFYEVALSQSPCYFKIFT
jgi:NADH-ubiquinone oxidoreductase chain 5